LFLSLFNPHIDLPSQSSNQLLLLYYYCCCCCCCIIVVYNLYNKPPCDSTPVLPGYLLLRHSYTWEKTSIFWLCQVFGAVAGEVNSCINYSIYFIFSFLVSNFVSFVFFYLLFFSYTCMRVWSHTLSGRLCRISSSFSKTMAEEDN
jgi:hypothetical protein